MKHLPFYIISCILLCVAACAQNSDSEQSKPVIEKAASDDRMLQALACDGCNDTFVVVVAIDSLEKAPMKLNILQAMVNHKVIGKLEAGDWCAILINEKDPTVADMVINMDMLKAKWVHQVYPTEREGIRDMLALEDKDMDIDSVIQAAMIPVERGFSLMRNHKASVIGENFLKPTDENSPVVYPEGSKYADWRVVNGLLIMSEADSILDPASQQMVLNKNIVRDTFEFVLLQKDSLQINYHGKRYDYYRLKEEKGK